MSTEPQGTRANPITHGGPDRRHRWCRCSDCGCVALCTPRFDFYTRQDPRGPLVCERCLMTERGGRR
jgi:hypothetical protein